MSPVAIRPARRSDGPALALLDHAVWDPAGSPGPRPAPDADFFAGTGAAGVLVADDGAPVGYAVLAAATRLQSNAHVQEVRGLAVAPERRGQGIGRRLLAAALEAAAAAGARRVRLRVLSTNGAAIRLYESAGFIREALLAEEFLIDGRYVDDLVMTYSVPSSST